MNSTVVNQIGIKISNKVTETFSEYFKRLNELPSPNMVAKLSLLWKQKNVKEKLLKYESLKEKHDILCLHTDFVVRKFRVGLTPQSPLDHIFSQVLFWDQARLEIFDSRKYEFNRQSALDIFFKKTPKMLGMFPGNPHLQHTTPNRHRVVISRLLLQKLKDNILSEPSPNFEH